MNKLCIIEEIFPNDYHIIDLRNKIKFYDNWFNEHDKILVNTRTNKEHKIISIDKKEFYEYNERKGRMVAEFYRNGMKCDIDPWEYVSKSVADLEDKEDIIVGDKFYYKYK